MNKSKKQRIEDLPKFSDWENKFFKKNPEQLPVLEKEILEDLRRYPNMPIEVFIASLRRLAELYGMSNLAEQSKVNREHLYKALSPKGNPTIKTVSKIANALGYRLTFTPL